MSFAFFFAAFSFILGATIVYLIVRNLLSKAGWKLDDPDGLKNLLVLIPAIVFGTAAAYVCYLLSHTAWYLGLAAVVCTIPAAILVMLVVTFAIKRASKLAAGHVDRSSSR